MKFKVGDIIQNLNGVNKYKIIKAEPGAYTYQVISHYSFAIPNIRTIHKVEPNSIHVEESYCIEEYFELE